MAIQYLDEEVDKSPIQYLDEEPQVSSIKYLDEEEPGIGKTVAGLGAEVAVGEGAKLAGAALGAKAGAAAGAFFGGVGAVPGAAIGATLGYVGGALAGGVGGSLLAQEIEGRDEASWGRVTADTALNLIPGGLGKASKGARLLPRLAKEGTRSEERRVGKECIV